MKSTFTEEIKVTGRQLKDAVLQIVKEGNARKLIIKTAKGRTLLETNLNIGAAGVGSLLYFAPLLTAVGALVMYATEFKIYVERDVSSEDEAEVIDVEGEEDEE